MVKSSASAYSVIIIIACNIKMYGPDDRHDMRQSSGPYIFDTFMHISQLFMMSGC